MSGFEEARGSESSFVADSDTVDSVISDIVVYMPPRGGADRPFDARGQVPRMQQESNPYTDLLQQECRPLAPKPPGVTGAFHASYLGRTGYICDK